jgi:pimeloyl-ACP methyl ester carboxylesterase
MTRLDISRPDGRVLEVEVDGPDDGQVVMFLTGTPSAGTLFSEHVGKGADRGLRHVAYSRPGYGRSDRATWRTVADCTADVVAIAEQLGIDELFVVGWSGGGPHALACAALLGDRVRAAATMASIAPWDAEGLDWLAGMGPENIEEFGVADTDEHELASFLERHAADFAGATGSDVQAAFGELLSDVDKAALSGEFADYIADSSRRAVEHGIWGWFDDDRAFLRNWGFDLGAIKRPVSIWQGGQDRMVPYAHGEWLASHVAGAHAELHPDEGHLSLALGAYGDILDGLLAA